MSILLWTVGLALAVAGPMIIGLECNMRNAIAINLVMFGGWIMCAAILGGK